MWPHECFLICAAYEPDEQQYIGGVKLREEYFDNLELMGDDNPCFSGELHFNGFAYFKCRYLVTAYLKAKYGRFSTYYGTAEKLASINYLVLA